MEIKISETSNIPVIEVSGEVDLYQTNMIRDKVTELIGENKNKAIVNMSGVSYIDSSGLGALISCRTNMKKAGGDLKLSSLTETVRSVLEITKLSQLFDIYETDQEAVQGFS